MEQKKEYLAGREQERPVKEWLNVCASKAKEGEISAVSTKILFLKFKIAGIQL